MSVNFIGNDPYGEDISYKQAEEILSRIASTGSLKIDTTALLAIRKEYDQAIKRGGAGLDKDDWLWMCGRIRAFNDILRFLEAQCRA